MLDEEYQAKRLWAAKSMDNAQCVDHLPESLYKVFLVPSCHSRLPIQTL